MLGLVWFRISPYLLPEKVSDQRHPNFLETLLFATLEDALLSREAYYTSEV
jgi:hypothetical protein